MAVGVCVAVVRGAVFGVDFGTIVFANAAFAEAAAGTSATAGDDGGAITRSEEGTTGTGDARFVEDESGLSRERTTMSTAIAPTANVDTSPSMM